MNYSKVLKFLGSRTPNFQGIIFIEKQTNKETLKFALAYPNKTNDIDKNGKLKATKKRLKSKRSRKIILYSELASLTRDVNTL